MPTAKPRIAITLPVHTYEVISRLAELNGEPMSRIVSDLVEAVSEPLMRTVALLEAAAAAPKQVRDGLRGTVEQMERELYGSVGYSVGQMDWLIVQMGKGGDGAATEPATARTRTALSGRSRREADPHNVIRGSGQRKSMKDKGTGISGKPGKKGGKNG